MQKVIKNDSVQGLELHLVTSQGVKTFWLQPDSFLVVPSNYLTPTVLNLAKRQLLKISNYE